MPNRPQWRDIYDRLEAEGVQEAPEPGARRLNCLMYEFKRVDKGRLGPILGLAEELPSWRPSDRSSGKSPGQRHAIVWIPAKKPAGA